MTSDDLSTDLDAFDQFEASAWEERVEGYADFFGAITGRLIEPLLNLARVGPGTRVLDVATGPGYVAAEAARRGSTVWAVDVAEAMVARAAAGHPDIDFTRADAQSLSFEDGTFDAVVANFGLPISAVRNSPSPKAYEPSLRGAVGSDDLGLSREDAHVRRLPGGRRRGWAGPPDGLPPGPDVFRFSDDEEFRRLLEAQGLVEVEVRRVAFTHEVESFEDLWSALQRGTVRMASLILGQPEPTRERIRAALEHRLTAYGTEGRFRVPISVKLAVGRKIG